MAEADLTRFLSPRSVAVIGGKWAREVAKQCVRANYTGSLYCVNPHQDGVPGVACYRSVEALPAAPDAAFVAVNRADTIPIIAALARQGCGGAVCFAAGFDESGAGDLTQRLLAAAGDMPFLGPNCYGYLNYLCNAPLWPDQHGGKPIASGVAILTQSGNISINLTMQRRGLPLAFICAMGNQTNIGFAALTRALLQNPAITAIGWLMEGADNAPALEQAMRAAYGKKPLVVLKMGASAQGASAALSHTATLTGNDAAAAAFFRRHGVAQVHTLPAFLETLKYLHICRVLRGRRLVSLSCSGGEAALVADRAAARRLTLADFSTADKARIRQFTGDLVALQNPFDYHTFVWGDFPAMQAIYQSVLACNYDLSLLVLDIPRGDYCDNSTYRRVADTFIAAVKAADNSGAAAITSALPDNMPEDLISHAAASGICCFAGLEEALDAAAAAADIGEAWQKPLAAPLCRRRQPPPAPTRRVYDEYETKQMLAAAGVCVPRGCLVGNAAAARRAAQTLSFPLAVKALGVAHKSECGGVCLHCASAAAVCRAINGMRELSDRFLIEEMITGVVAECIVGVQYDETAGLAMTIGAGGIWAEVLQDVAVVLLPTSQAQLRAALASLRAAPMWQGGRGRRAAKLAAVVGCLAKIAAFAEQRVEHLLEMDINPLMLTAQGALAADALLVEHAPPEVVECPLYEGG